MSSRVANTASSCGERSFAAASPPCTSDEMLPTIESGMEFGPPNTTAKPGATQPAGALLLEHQADAAGKFDARNVLTDADNVAVPAGVRITGTASRAGRANPATALVVGAIPVVGANARNGALACVAL